VTTRRREAIPERICPACANTLRALRSYQRIGGSGTTLKQFNMYACDSCRTGRLAAHPYGALGVLDYYPVGKIPPEPQV
jgi:hypothetical protein